MTLIEKAREVENNVMDITETDLFLKYAECGAMDLINCEQFSLQEGSDMNDLTTYFFYNFETDQQFVISESLAFTIVKYWNHYNAQAKEDGLNELFIETGLMESGYVEESSLVYNTLTDHYEDLSEEQFQWLGDKFTVAGQFGRFTLLNVVKPIGHSKTLLSTYVIRCEVCDEFYRLSKEAAMTILHFKAIGSHMDATELVLSYLDSIGLHAE